MDIVIDIQGFRDVEEKFIPKEVAVVAVNAPIIGHWIMTPPYPFDELPEKSRRENNWLSRNYHGIEWFDGETKQKYFAIQLREITRQARYIYSRGQEKVLYLRRLLSRNVYNLEGISPSFKDLPEDKERGHRCSRHGFQFWPTDKFLCALRNAYKLKHWLVAENTSECGSDRTNLSHENWKQSGGGKSDSGIFTNKNLRIIRNIKTRYNTIEEEKEEENRTCDCVEKANYIPSVKKEYLPTTQGIRDNPHSLENSCASKKVNSETVQIIPLALSPPRCLKNEFTGNLTSAATTQCQICCCLSCRQTAEGVDEVDRHRR